tara:strand:- start:1470 stop:2534 length:1065 start_codon:yes stop_codon:yes gene_type:complete
MINVYNVLGIMSGTSLDGLDLALTTFNKDVLNNWSYKIVLAKTLSYPNSLTERLKSCTSLSGLELIQLQNDWTEFVIEQVNRFKLETETPIDLIGNHGHTVFHQINKRLTFQLANNAALAAKTGIRVIGDFRSSDVAMNGQGAPLVPIGDQLLFHHYDACINLGGIANISFESNGERLAYDCCPFNLPLNRYASELGLKYDEGGQLAAKGKVNETLLQELSQIDYFHSTYPKSLGIEWVENHFMNSINKYTLSIADILATLIELFAQIISDAINLSKANNCLITGGGAYNSYFIERLENKTKAQIVVPGYELIEFKEAIIFGFLGVLRSREENNTISSVTGALRSHSSGGLYLP